MIGYITCSVKKFAAHDTLFIVGDERMRSACAAELLHYIKIFNQLFVHSEKFINTGLWFSGIILA
jgi:hypothetical protein